MNKEEILRRSRKEYRAMDEREQRIMTQSILFATLGMEVMFFILFLIEVFVKGGAGYALLTMNFSFLMAQSIYKYGKIGRKKEFVSICAYLTATVTFFLLYVMK